MKVYYTVFIFYYIFIECGKNVVLKWSKFDMFANLEYVSVTHWIVPNNTFENVYGVNQIFYDDYNNKIVVIPDSFKGTLSSMEICKIIEEKSKFLISNLSNLLLKNKYPIKASKAVALL